MFVICVACYVILSVFSVTCEIDTTGNNYKSLPPIFYIDDYEECKQQQLLFCRVSITLSPNKLNPEIWELIQETKKHTRYYNHDELFHAICVQKFCSEFQIYNNRTFQERVSQCYTKKYHNIGLRANVTSYDCNNYDNIYEARVYDIFYVVILFCLGIIILTASICDYRVTYSKSSVDVSLNGGWPYLKSFSIISNWKKLRRNNENIEFQKLKSLQGIRFYNTLLILFCHTYSSYIGGYVSNTEYLEQIEDNPLKLWFRNLLVFLVQTFFLFSAFLLSYHVFQDIENGKEFNGRYMLLNFLKRYLRILPPVLIMVCLGTSIWIVSVFYGPIKEQYSDVEYLRCQKNWWTSLLFINNHYNENDMCYFITWYLAADTQLYALSLVILSLIWKYRKLTNLVITISVAIGIVIPSAMCYVYNLDIIYRITPENSKNNKFRSFAFNATYSSTYANMATYMLGLGFGYIYYKDNQLKLFKYKFSTFFWWLLFLGLPFMMVVVSSYEYTPVYSSILSGILKPLYALGIGIGILGMSQKMGGVLRSVCEWKTAIFFGNFTYSTYIVHYGIVFARTITAKEPLYLSDFVLLTSFIQDVVLSFTCGFLMHVFVEMPALQIQNMLLPHIRRKGIKQS